jgi:tRNA A22 N-methylase
MLNSNLYFLIGETNPIGKLNTIISSQIITKKDEKFYSILNIRKRKISKEVDQESKEEFIIAIFLYQTLKQYSYREVLQELKYLGFKTPSKKAF